MLREIRRRRLRAGRFALGAGFLLVAACNSREPLFDQSTVPTAPTAASAAFGLSVTPTGVMGGTPAVGIVGLTAPAPAGGLLMSLSSTTPAATVPTSVTVPAGSESAQFPITTRSVGADTEATIVASSPAGTVAAKLALWSEQPTYLSLWYEPSPGGFVIGRRFIPPTNSLTAACSGSSLSVSFGGLNIPTRVFFSAPTGSPLRPGNYEDVRSTVQTAAAAALDVTGADLSTCSGQAARFVVHEAQFGIRSEPTRRFSATFERRCSLGTLSIWGELRLTSVANTFGTGCLR